MINHTPDTSSTVSLFHYGEKELNHLRQKDKKLGAAIDRIHVEQMVQRFVEPDLFANLVRSIIAQQVSRKAADTVYGRFQGAFGNITPENLLTKSIDDIQKLGVSARKAGYLFNTATMIATGELDLDGLRTMSDDQVVSSLSKLPGIGKWTAEMILIFSLGRMDVVSYGDLALLRGMCNLYGHDTITKDLFQKYRKRYSPYGTVASFYLWELSHSS